ncbi:MAG TPA: Tol-Pal system beta propeller repeat protein TolB [Deltaproteobacteria bacterium]|nr:Tol-Pal system beta propeller repeat protein TolB [Deltaproteobacteria bacterium]
MKKIYFILFTIILSLCAVPALKNNAAAKVYIDIDSPAFQQFPIAICDFNNITEGTQQAHDTGIIIADEIKKYLSLTGIFNILDKRSYLEKMEPGNPEALENIYFPHWSLIGADFLLRGNIMKQGEQIIVDSRLFDVTRGQRLLGKKYISRTGNHKEIAKSIASDILLTLTGDEGEFSTKIAFVSVSKRGVRSDIEMIDYDGTNLKSITNHQSLVMSPRWSPDGASIAFTSFKEVLPKVFIKNLKTGKERKVASFEGLNLCGSFSPDGNKLLLTLSKDGIENIYSLDLKTLKLNRLTHSYSIDVSPAWSPDGRKIAFVSNRGGSPQVYVMDADGNNVRRITFEGNYNTSPAWSPQGNRIAYEGRIAGRYQIFSVDPEGNNLIQLTFDDADNESPSWSPSGRQIAYSSKTAFRSRIKVMNANGLNIRILSETNDILVMPAWSPRFK